MVCLFWHILCKSKKHFRSVRLARSAIKMTTATAAESTTTSTAGSPASKSGADFRGSIPKTQPSGESADGPRIGSKEVGVAMESSGRFGMAGKPTQKGMSFVF